MDVDLQAVQASTQGSGLGGTPPTASCGRYTLLGEPVVSDGLDLLDGTEPAARSQRCQKKWSAQLDERHDCLKTARFLSGAEVMTPFVLIVTTMLQTPSPGYAGPSISEWPDRSRCLNIARVVLEDAMLFFQPGSTTVPAGIDDSDLSADGTGRLVLRAGSYGNRPLMVARCVPKAGER